MRICKQLWNVGPFSSPRCELCHIWLPRQIHRDIWCLHKSPSGGGGHWMKIRSCFRIWSQNLKICKNGKISIFTSGTFKTLIFGLVSKFENLMWKVIRLKSIPHSLKLRAAEGGGIAIFGPRCSGSSTTAIPDNLMLSMSVGRPVRANPATGCWSDWYDNKRHGRDRLKPDRSSLGSSCSTVSHNVRHPRGIFTNT